MHGNLRYGSYVLAVLLFLGGANLSVAGLGRQEPQQRESPRGEQADGASGSAAQSAGEKEGAASDAAGKSRAEELRSRMVAQQIEARGVSDPQVLQAMRAVPRHRFVPSAPVERAYADRPLPIGEGQTISQPYIVAYMTEMLQLAPEDKVLEIGTGSGYQAAVLAEISDQVWSIEIIDELAAQAEERLQRLGYTEVATRQGDGYYGWESAAPFDAIIVTAAAGHLPPPLIRQLKPGGRMVIPLGGTYEVQSLMLVRKNAQGEIVTERLKPVRFVPMTGAAQE
jgi:protein-L-isoaspartate(D-aspartate) O-methyltransferase